MPHPLDAERAASESPAQSRPRPTPAPRASAEALTTATAVEDDPGDVPADLAAAPPGVDVWALVHSAQQGDAEAFGELYDHYVTMVHRYVYHRVGDRATAEDVTSETFVRALRRIDSLSFQGRDVGAWLVTIARNIIFDHVKSSRYRLEVTTADMRDADRATDGPEDAVLTHLTNRELLACVQQLGERAAGVHRAALHPRPVGVRDGRDHGQEGRRHQGAPTPRRPAAGRPPPGRSAMTGNFFVGSVTEYGFPSLDGMQRGAPDAGLLPQRVFGGRR